MSRFANVVEYMIWIHLETIQNLGVREPLAASSDVCTHEFILKMNHAET
jgi:hypothetical protein